MLPAEYSCAAMQVDIAAKIGALFETAIQFADSSEAPFDPPEGARFAMQVRNRDTSQLLLSLDSEGENPKITVDEEGFIRLKVTLPENLTPQTAVYDFLMIEGTGEDEERRVLFEGNFDLRRQITDV